MDLHNKALVQNQLNTYLNKRKFLIFGKRGTQLLQPGEKFIKVSRVKELSFGLNNVVFDLTVQFRNSDKSMGERDYILRVYPDNNMSVKAKGEAARLEMLQQVNIPKAKLFFFEEDLSILGYRFLILEKLAGKPVLETVHMFTDIQTKEFLADLARFLGNMHSVRNKKYDSYYLDKSQTKKMEFADYLFTEVNQILQGFTNLHLDSELNVDTRYLFKWCRGHRPLLQLNGYSLTHGDIRPSNIIVKGNKISGFIDWEMSCYSDPAQDLGWTLFFFKLYDNLKNNRGFFFTEYWKYCEMYDFEARVYFYEFLAALKLYTYARSTEISNPEKYEHNKDFFTRIRKIFPNYINTVTHQD